MINPKISTVKTGETVTEIRVTTAQIGYGTDFLQITRFSCSECHDELEVVFDEPVGYVTPCAKCSETAFDEGYVAGLEEVD